MTSAKGKPVTLHTANGRLVKAEFECSVVPADLLVVEPITDSLYNSTLRLTIGGGLQSEHNTYLSEEQVRQLFNALAIHLHRTG